ncbi:MAG: MFS transporter [Anaerolineales bacterium]|nr:MFS transporter [Anaerolineales bacterium]
MLNRLRNVTSGYPRQFWLIFWGMLINSTGGSMVWPFLTIYMRQQLNVPLTSVALLLTIYSVASLLTTSFTGPAVDRFGRKGVMLVSLLVGGGVLLGMRVADTLPLWAALMAIFGGFDPLLRIGGNAMVADLVEPERRTAAYALLRTIANLGVAIGPSIGGFITSVSYAIAFFIAAAAQILYAMLVLFFVSETAPRREADEQPVGVGYGPVLRDRGFVSFCGMYVLSVMSYSLIMILLPVYVKENFGVPENQYGFIMATNAAMVVLLQYVITRVTERFRAFMVLAVGSLFIGLGVGSVAWGSGFFAFLISMILLTIGEMIIVPTSTALTANFAPIDMRGRYMGLYSLVWSVGFGIGPVIGGLLNDQLAPVAIWYGGLVMGLLGAIGFLILERKMPSRAIDRMITI